MGLVTRFSSQAVSHPSMIYVKTRHFQHELSTHILLRLKRKFVVTGHFILAAGRYALHCLFSWFHFLPRDAMRISAVFAVARCPSVKLVHCIHMAKDIVKLLSRPDSPMILVFLTPSTDTQFQGEPLQPGR